MLREVLWTCADPMDRHISDQFPWVVSPNERVRHAVCIEGLSLEFSGKTVKMNLFTKLMPALLTIALILFSQTDAWVLDKRCDDLGLLSAAQKLREDHILINHIRIRRSCSSRHG